MKKLSPAQQAYEDWLSSQKVSMMVYTDAQMFEMGFDTATQIMDDMANVILAMEKDAKKMEAEIKKLKKNAKPTN